MARTKYGRYLLIFFNIFNLFNTPANTQWNVGANQVYSPNYLARFNRHPPRSLQISLAAKF